MLAWGLRSEHFLQRLAAPDRPAPKIAGQPMDWKVHDISHPALHTCGSVIPVSDL